MDTPLTISDVVVCSGATAKSTPSTATAVGFAELPDFKSAEAEQNLPQKPRRRDGMER
jgi:hypothetical protein